MLEDFNAYDHLRGSASTEIRSANYTTWKGSYPKKAVKHRMASQVLKIWPKWLNFEYSYM